ncbi:MAG: carbohydrate ABC transporter permease [Spirochaetaceae bacterium]|nr:MAG: carbohydrate ABC transporter permease [Spirochaetaceae bacterium]
MRSDVLRETPIVIQYTAKAGKWILLIGYLGVAILPLLWLGMSSFKTEFEIISAPLSLPQSLHYENFVNAIRISGLHRFFLNSFIVATCATTFNLFICSLAAFAVARERWRLRSTFLTFSTAMVLVPIISFMVPYYALILRLGLFNSIWALVLTYTAINIPISLFLITNFMKALPSELDDSAVIDGCNFWQRFSKIVLPLTKPGLATAGTFAVIGSWNEFVYAMLLTSSERARTVQFAVRFFSSEFRDDYGGMFAAIVLTMIPTIFIYILMHDKIVSGVTAGAVKG